MPHNSGAGCIDYALRSIKHNLRIRSWNRLGGSASSPSPMLILKLLSGVRARRNCGRPGAIILAINDDHPTTSARFGASSPWGTISDLARTRANWMSVSRHLIPTYRISGKQVSVMRSCHAVSHRLDSDASSVDFKLHHYPPSTAFLYDLRGAPSAFTPDQDSPVAYRSIPSTLQKESGLRHSFPIGASRQGPASSHGVTSTIHRVRKISHGEERRSAPDIQ